MLPHSEPAQDDLHCIDLAIATRQTRRAKREALRELRPQLLQAARAYRHHLPAGRIPAPQSMSALERGYLLAAYDTMQADGHGSGLRDIILTYDREMIRACSFCGTVDGEEIDHFLPKEAYPELAVATCNLVPACGRCNKKKDDLVTSSSGSRFPHPYFDPELRQEFLAVNLIERSGRVVAASFRFDTTLVGAGFADRLTWLDERLGVLKRAQRAANGELIARFDSVGLLLAPNSQALADATESEVIAGSARHGPNHWRVALYRALLRHRGRQMTAGS